MEKEFDLILKRLDLDHPTWVYDFANEQQLRSLARAPSDKRSSVYNQVRHTILMRNYVFIQAYHNVVWETKS